MNRLIQQYDQPLRYLFFGVLTTIVNYLSFWVLIRIFGAQAALLENLGSFFAATTFAYLTNKIFVFKRNSWKWKIVCREAVSFAGTRLFSFGLEEAGLYVCISALHAPSYSLWGINGLMISKILLSGIAVILNYLFSKCLVFRKRQKAED